MASYDGREQAGENAADTESPAVQGARRQTLASLILSGAALTLAVLHIIWPSLRVDTITIVLFVVAVIPWVSPIFSSVEGPGGWKVEFREVQKQVREQRRQVVDLSDRIQKVEDITFSGTISNQSQTKLAAVLDSFRTYLTTLGIPISDKAPRVHVGPRSDHDPAYADFNAFYDHHENEIVVGELLTEDTDVICREYLHYVLGTLVPKFRGVAWSGSERELEIGGLWSGIADYIPCSFSGSPIFGAVAAHALSDRLNYHRPYIRDLSSKVTMTDLRASQGITVTAQSIGEVWGGALWEIRTKLGREVVDPVIISAWRSLNGVGTRAPLGKTFAANFVSSLGADAAKRKEVKDVFSDRGLATLS